MSGVLPQLIDESAPIFTVTVAANLAGMHPQTLRTYDRLGIVVPNRTKGHGRRYSRRDLKRLRLIQHLSQEEGINLNGIKKILDMHDYVEKLETQIENLAGALEEARSMLVTGTVSSRVFTADATGNVHLGRRRLHSMNLAITKG